MSNITYLPTYDQNIAQPIVTTTNLGSHQVCELADGTMTLESNTVDMPEYDFTALEHIRLDELEQYRLFMVLHTKFMK